MTRGTGIKIDATGMKRKITAALKALDPEGLLFLIGQRGLNWVARNFKAKGLDRPWAPLSPNTIASRRRGGDQPLQDTGRLRASFTANVAGNAVAIGSILKVAEWHQFGTKPYKIRPKNTRFLKFKTANGFRFAREVNHPGLKARPMLPTKASARRLAIETIDNALRSVNGAG